LNRQPAAAARVPARRNWFIRLNREVASPSFSKFTSSLQHLHRAVSHRRPPPHQRRHQRLPTRTRGGPGDGRGIG